MGFFIDELKGFLKLNDINYLVNEPMKNHTSFKIGGPADIFITPGTKEKIKKSIDFCAISEIPYMIVGNGSNLLISDDGIRGAVIHIGSGLCKISVNNDIITCESGAKLSSLCQFAYEHSLSGLEFAYGIPGSVGGAVYMNAGAYGGEIKDVILSASYYDEKKGFCECLRNDMELSYRHSIFSEKNLCITEASFLLHQASKDDIKEKMNELMARRKEKQPLNLPSAGSTFKRPPGHYASALIEQCGLKGSRIGGACVSEKHSGFVVNDGDATCDDVKRLIEFIKQRVYKETGVMLECEVLMV